MGEILHPKPVLLIVAISSRYDAALAWSRLRVADEFGTLGAVSEPFTFTETDYYTSTMGSDLKKQFVAAAHPIDPGRLAAIKRMTNGWEDEYASQSTHPEPRPLNLDPGYLTKAKLVLASTKDHAHRIYLIDGIYAEVTLSYRGKQWHDFPWTYPDYRRQDFQQFFAACRSLLK